MRNRKNNNVQILLNLFLNAGVVPVYLFLINTAA